MREAGFLFYFLFPHKQMRDAGLLFYFLKIFFFFFFFFSQNRNKFVYKERVIELKIWCQLLLVKLKNNFNDSKHISPLGAFLTKFMNNYYI